MSTRIKDAERIKLIAEYIKTQHQPDGYIIKETSNGQYRVSKTKSEREILEQKRERLQKQLEDIEHRFKELNANTEQINDSQEVNEVQQILNTEDDVIE